MLWVLEVVAGLLLCAFGIGRDQWSGAAQADFGLKQSLVALAGFLVAADGAWRARAPRRGLLASLEEASPAGFLATFLLAGVLLALVAYTFHHYQVDDSWITYRYARTTLETGQVTWNPGGAAVEGYSNFLWMLLAMGALALRADPLLVSRIVAMACLAVSALLVHRLARGACTTPLGPRLSVLALLATPSLAFWGMSGLETASVVALTLGWLAAFRADFDRARAPWRTALMGLLLVLSRPEGPLLVGLTLLPSLASSRPGERRRAIHLALLVAALSAPYLAWKQVHFGTLVPNTLSAKWRTLAGLPLAMASLQFVFPLLPFAAARLARGGSRLERQAWLLWGGLTLASVNVSPQVAHYHRFILPAWGALAALVGVYAEQVAAWPGFRSAKYARPAGMLLAAAWLAYLLGPIFEMRIYADGEAKGLETAHHPIGRVLASTFRPGELLAASDCGIIPYVSNMRTLDLWGLTDRSIATRGFDPEAVVRRRPDVVILNSLHPDFFAGREAYDRRLHEALAADTSLRVRGRWPFYGYWLWVYARRPLSGAPPGS